MHKAKKKQPSANCLHKVAEELQRWFHGVDASAASYLGDHDHQKVLFLDVVFGDRVLVRENLAYWR
jgi:hypothetical protein